MRQTAFPAFISGETGTDTVSFHSTGGMELRDYFAAAALTGLCSRYNLKEPGDQIVLAKLSYELADTMILAGGRL